MRNLIVMLTRFLIDESENKIIAKPHLDVSLAAKESCRIFLEAKLKIDSEEITISYHWSPVFRFSSIFLFLTHFAPDPSTSTILLIQVWSIGITLCELVTPFARVHFFSVTRENWCLETQVGCHFEAHVWQLLAQWTFTQRSRLRLPGSPGCGSLKMLQCCGLSFFWRW